MRQGRGTKGQRDRGTKAERGIAFLLLAFLLPGIGNATDPGQTAANFLKIGVGVRAQGLAGAYTGVSDDISAVYWNPGGLGQLRSKEIFLMHNEWLQGVKHDCLAFGMPTRFGVFAINSNLLTIDTDNNWKAKDMVCGLGWGYGLANLSLGINLKSVSEQIASRKGSCYGADVGILYNFLPWLRVGVSCQNIGGGLKIIQDEYPLPITVRTGAALSLSNLLLSLDISDATDHKPVYAAGAEYTLAKCVSLRCGWRSQEEGLGSLNGLAEGTSMGIGVKLPYWNVDYAYLPYGLLGETQQVSLGLRFGQPGKRPASKSIIRDIATLH